jgi:hypothetical protein
MTMAPAALSSMRDRLPRRKMPKFLIVWRMRSARNPRVIAPYDDERSSRRIYASRPAPPPAPYPGGLPFCARLTVVTLALRSRLLQRSLPSRATKNDRVRGASDLIGAEPAKNCEEASIRRGRLEVRAPCEGAIIDRA